MAEGKKSFVFYSEWIENFTELTDLEAGKLIKHILLYVNDENPDTDDRYVKLAFLPIKQALKRDLKKYEVYCDKQKINGRKGGAKKGNQNAKKTTQTTQTTQRLKKQPKQADNVNVNDNDNVSLTEIGEKEVKTLDVIYEEVHFLKNWNEARSMGLDQPSNLNRLSPEEKDLFFSVKDDYKKVEFHNALNGLFKQEKVPSDIMWFRPKHLLAHIDTYIDANNNKQFKLYA